MSSSMVFVRARRRRRLKRLPSVQKWVVDAGWEVIFCLTVLYAEEEREQCGSQNASLLDAVGDWEAVRETHCALPDLC